jgi:hypothetical protein
VARTAQLAQVPRHEGSNGVRHVLEQGSIDHAGIFALQDERMARSPVTGCARCGVIDGSEGGD